MEVVSVIAKVVQAIVKAAATARENSRRCRDLAVRVSAIGGILLLDSSTASTSSSANGYTARLRTLPLEMLKDALQEALELVESQQPGGFGADLMKLVTSDKTADRFQKVEDKIADWVNIVGLAEQFAAAYRARHANTGTGSAPSLAPEHHHQSLQFAPPPTKQHQSFQCASSLPQHLESFPSLLGSSQQQSAMSLLQEHQSLPQRPSLRLPSLQQKQSLKSASLLQEHQSLLQHPSLQLASLQQKQSFQSEESPSQQRRSSQSTTPPLQQQQSLRQRPSLRLAPSQHNQSFQPRESSSQQQRSSPSTTLPLQQHQNLLERPSLRLSPSQQHQQQRLQSGESAVAAAIELAVCSTIAAIASEFEAATPGISARKLASAADLAARCPALPPSQQHQHLIPRHGGTWIFVVAVATTVEVRAAKCELWCADASSRAER